MPASAARKAGSRKGKSGHERKADRLLEELGWTLAVLPAVPRGAHWRLIGVARDGDPQWATYLREPSAA